MHFDITYLISIVLGLIIGSFINVVVVRVPHGQSVIKPRSQCPGCKKSIAWFDNIPVLSFLFLKGKCRHCKTTISIRYPIIELLVALLFVAARIRFGWDWILWLRDWPFLAALVAVTFIDLEHRIIPDSLSLGGLVLGLSTCYWVQGLGLLRGVLGAALGFGLFYLMAWFYQTRRQKMGLGGGDIKLIAMLGAFLGPEGVFATILISSVCGSVVGLAWGYFTKQKQILSVAIPYGPFLVIGGLYYYFLGDSLWFPFMTLM